LWLHSLKVAQLLRSAACLHTNQSRSYLNHLVVAAVYETITTVISNYPLIYSASELSNFPASYAIQQASSNYTTFIEAV